MTTRVPRGKMERRKVPITELQECMQNVRRDYELQEFYEISHY
jgi:hypothetical protein